MIYKTNIGWVYLEDLIYLKIETKNIIKIIRYVHKIKK